MDLALYYPYMDAPQSAWFAKVLLYWDGVATIVPREYQHLGSTYMDELTRAKLVRQMSPDEALSGVNIDSFTSMFLQHVESQFTSDTLEFTDIHAGKMSYQIFSELKKMGLARSRMGRGRSGWYQVETVTASHFMAFLAGVMSGRSSNLTPVTDTEAHIAALGTRGRSQKERLDALRYIAISKALPTPSGPVAPIEIVRFKERYGEELRRCRKYLDLNLMELTYVETEGEFPEYALQLKIERFQDEMVELQLKLQAEMYQRSWPGVIRASYGAVTAAGLSGATSIASGGSALVLGLAVAATAAALIDPARTAFGQLRQPRDEHRSPLIYAVLAGTMPSSATAI